MGDDKSDDDECAGCGHFRVSHREFGGCLVSVGTCGDGCCVFLCECNEFVELKEAASG